MVQASCQRYYTLHMQAQFLPLPGVMRPGVARRAMSSSMAALDCAQTNTLAAGTLLSLSGLPPWPPSFKLVAPGLLAGCSCCWTATPAFLASRAETMPMMAEVLPVPGGPCTSKLQSPGYRDGS